MTSHLLGAFCAVSQSQCHSTAPSTHPKNHSKICDPAFNIYYRTGSNTDKVTCRTLIELLVGHGVEYAVLSPGSRNTPLVVAAERCPQLKTFVAIDERAAAFAALGMALQSRTPVAVICTSGTAVLNYAPAVAEAYYRGVPLIVVSADRPGEWIDQDDSQTIRQYRVLENIVKASVNIPAGENSHNHQWYASRLVNQAINTALDQKPGPVHINIAIDEPLGRLTEVADDIKPKLILNIKAASKLTLPDLGRFRRILIIGGFRQWNQDVSPDILKALIDSGKIVLLSEAQSSLDAPVTPLDLMVGAIPEDGIPDYLPDLVITFGGAILSRWIKKFFRKNPPAEHWHVNRDSSVVVDCFRALTTNISEDVSQVLEALADSLDTVVADKEFVNRWEQLRKNALDYATTADRAPWSDLVAMHDVMNAVPDDAVLHLSNGTTVRYAQFFWHRGQEIECNRGVSGIDGSTATAIGAAAITDKPLWLITGDMSALYDLGGLALGFAPDNFKMIVLDNSGGGIFRYITSTKSLPELERNFVTEGRLPARYLALAFGYGYFRADSRESLSDSLQKFAYHPAKAILHITTPGTLSGEIIDKFLTFKKI